MGLSVCCLMAGCGPASYQTRTIWQKWNKDELNKAGFSQGSQLQYDFVFNQLWHRVRHWGTACSDYFQLKTECNKMVTICKRNNTTSNLSIKAVAMTNKMITNTSSVRIMTPQQGTSKGYGKVGKNKRHKCSWWQRACCVAGFHLLPLQTASRQSCHSNYYLLICNCLLSLTGQLVITLILF